MIEKIKALCIKHREILVYLIVGGLTTVVAWGCKFLWNILFYGATAYPTGLQNTVLSVVENVTGIAFASRLSICTIADIRSRCTILVCN